MPQQVTINTQPLHRFLTAYMDQLPRRRGARTTVTLYVVHEAHIRAILIAKKTYGNQRINQPLFSSPDSAWSLPEGDVLGAMQRRDTVRSEDGHVFYTPFVPLDAASSDTIGLLEVQQSFPVGPGFNTSYFGLESETLKSEQRTFEALRLQMLVNWQTEVLHTLHALSIFEPGKHTPESTYETLLAAALTIAPMACLAHLITVIPDPVSGEPTTLRLEYAHPSPHNPPKGKLDVKGPYTEAHPRREYPVTEGLTGECVLERREIHVDTIEGLRHYKLLYDRTQSEACFPLTVGDRIIGVLNLESESKSAFTQSDLQHLKILAQAVAHIMAATTGDLSLYYLYEKGLLTFAQVLGAVRSPERLISAVLEWARNIISPPYEYGEFRPDDDLAALDFPASGDAALLANGLSPAMRMSLRHGDTYYGTLTLYSAREQPASRVRASQILGHFEPLLGPLIHASIQMSDARRRNDLAWLAGALSHTSQNLHTEINALIERSSAALASDDALHEAYLTGMLNLIDVFCNIAANAAPDDQDKMFEVTEAVYRVRDAMEWRFLANGINLRVESPQSQIFIKGDQSKLHWALIELLANALKFSREQGGQEVKVSIHPSPRSKRVLIWVEDQCRVIPPDEREAIFEIHYRGHDAQDGNVSGRGVGLHTVHKCVVKELHGTREVFESSALRGNKFILSFATDWQSSSYTPM